MHKLQSAIEPIKEPGPNDPNEDEEDCETERYNNYDCVDSTPSADECPPVANGGGALRERRE